MKQKLYIVTLKDHTGTIKTVKAQACHSRDLTHIYKYPSLELQEQMKKLPEYADCTEIQFQLMEVLNVEEAQFYIT